MIDEIQAGPVPEDGRLRQRRRPNVRETRERRRRVLTWTLSIVLGVLLVNALVGEHGYLATIGAEREAARLRAEVAALRRENADLQRRALRLQQDRTALEEAARDLNFIRPGETLVIVRDARGDTPPAGR
jgi:cell division protein FtsB